MVELGTESLHETLDALHKRTPDDLRRQVLETVSHGKRSINSISSGTHGTGERDSHGMAERERLNHQVDKLERQVLEQQFNLEELSRFSEGVHGLVKVEHQPPTSLSIALEELRGRLEPVKKLYPDVFGCLFPGMLTGCG